MPGDSVILKVGIFDHNARKYFRALRWFKNSSEIITNERFLISGDGKSLVINGITEAEAGLYEAKFTYLVLPSFSQKCTTEVFEVLEPYAIVSPVTFHLLIKGM